MNSNKKPTNPDSLSQTKQCPYWYDFYLDLSKLKDDSANELQHSCGLT
jgi:hypothetical protein